MKLWRKTQDENGNSVLTQVTDVKQIDAEKPVLFVLPGRTCVNGAPDCERNAAGAVKAAQNMLGSEAEHEILVATYDEKTGHGKRRYLNHKLDAAQDADADVFVKDFLKPLTEKGAKISLFGLSYGGVFAEAARATFIREARQEGKGDSAIRDTLSGIYNIQIANISRATQPEAKGRDHSLDYSSVFFTFANDLTTRVDGGRPSFAIPKAHGREDVTIAELSGNRCNVVVNAPREMLRQNEEGEWSLVENKSRIPHVRTNHMIDFFLLKDDPIGVYPLLERSLHNAVNREGRPSVQNLLTAAPQKSYAPSTPEVTSLPERADELYGKAQHLSEGWAARIRLGRQAQQTNAKGHSL